MGVVSRYNRELLEAKLSYPYQSMTFKLFRQVYPFTKNKFYWDSQFIRNHPLLWYRASSATPGEYKPVRVCLVDIPFWKAVLFRWYTKWVERKEELTKIEHSLRKNDSTLMLTDIQATIQRQLDSNETMIRRELANLRRQSAQLTPFQEDYVKTKIEVEV